MSRRNSFTLVHFQGLFHVASKQESLGRLARTRHFDRGRAPGLQQQPRGRAAH